MRKCSLVVGAKEFFLPAVPLSLTTKSKIKLGTRRRDQAGHRDSTSMKQGRPPAQGPREARAGSTGRGREAGFLQDQAGPGEFSPHPWAPGSSLEPQLIKSHQTCVR